MSETIHLPVRVSADTVSDEMLELINRQTIEPVTMDEIFSFSGVCSNDRMDSYLTKMDPVTTLRNYEEDLKVGTSLLSGHDISKNPFGRSYDGELITGDDDNNTSVRGYWYILRDLTINGEDTNHTIRAIKSGILRDMSVGFGGNSLWYRCSSCGRSLSDWDCTHIPGLEDENGRISFAWIQEARLREVSLVYKGATPGAFVDKAREFINQGQLEMNNILRLEQQYQVRLDDGKRSFFMPKKEGEKQAMNILDELRTAIRENKLEKGRVYEILTEEGDAFRQPDDIAIRNELGKEFTSIQAIRQLKKEAQQGRRYLADVIDEAVSARVKAQGDSFNAESYRNMLNHSADIDAIKEEIEAYDRMAKQRFTPGRQTEDDQLPGENEEEDVHETSRVNNDEINFFDRGEK